MNEAIVDLVVVTCTSTRVSGDLALALVLFTTPSLVGDTVPVPSGPGPGPCADSELSDPDPGPCACADTTGSSGSTA